MPFYNDGTLVFCVNDEPVRCSADQKVKQLLRQENLEVAYRPWKLAIADWTTKRIRNVNLPFPNDAVLCNPTFYEEDGVLNVSFIAGKPTTGAEQYRLYHTSGTSWLDLAAPQVAARRPARTGFVNARFYCLGSASELLLLDRQDDERYRLTTSLQRISRAIYDPEKPDRLLITGMNRFQEFLTLIFDTETRSVQEVRGPAPCYKACLVGSRIVFAYRESEELEDYHIHIAPAVFQPTDETVQMVKG